MKRSVYLDTTIPSFMFEVRDDVDSLAKRQWVEAWWEQREAFAVHASELVLAELERGHFPGRQCAIDLVERLPFLEIDPEVRIRAATYRGEGVMPAKDTGDSIHLALASHYKMDYLLSYNFSHLVNPNKMDSIRRVNAKYGYWNPTLCTPEMLLREE